VHRVVPTDAWVCLQVFWKNYYIENKGSKVWLEKTKFEKESRKNSEHAGVSKANRALGWMRKKLFNIKLFKILYLAFVKTWN